MPAQVSDTWERGDPYERYVGRWSRRVAPRFLSWLALPPGQRWLDVGCGTGALCAAIADQCSPASLAGAEPSEGFLMELMRVFWDAAVALNPAAAALDEGLRFPLCRPDALEQLFAGAGLKEVATVALDVPTPFDSFDDYWQPFLGGQGPAPAYTMSLDEVARARLREQLRQRLPVRPDGSIALTARAWAVRATSGAAAAPRSPS